MPLTTLVLLGITVLQRVLTEGSNQPLATDRRLRLLSLIVIPAYLIATYCPFPAHFFHPAVFGPVQWSEVLSVVLPTYLVSWLSDQLPSSVRDAPRSPS